ncbi:MAG: putative transcriptional regulator [Firmicutes bacterium]|nr:putative transcriptional regulator [Bacillota bacterium]
MQTVGEILRSEREKKGLTIKDIEKGTSIRGLYIQALEDGDYKVLPGEVYLKGFLRNYATFIGLDPQEMLKLYHQSQNPEPPVPEPVPEQKQKPVKEPKPVPEQKLAKEPTSVTEPAAESQAEHMEPRRSTSASRWPVVAVAVVAVIIVGWGAVSYFGTSTPPENKAKVEQPAVPPATQQVAPNVAKTPAPGTPAAPGVKAPGAADGKPVAVSAKFTAECWVRATVDGKEVYLGTPKVGETLSWSADKDVTLKLGNAGGVEMTYNGQSQGRAGYDGEVAVKTFSANTPAPTTTPAPAAR